MVASLFAISPQTASEQPQFGAARPNLSFPILSDAKQVLRRRLASVFRSAGLLKENSIEPKFIWSI